MNSIQKVFGSAREKGRKLFIPYITCGDPDLASTVELVEKLTAIGADIIELGVPFSDPLADGATNQLSAERALQHKVNIKDCLDVVQKLRQQACQVPLVLFSYFNPIFQFGLLNFVEQAKRAGVDGVLVVDLPIEEAEEWNGLLAQQQIGSIFLVSPTTTRERLQKSIQMTTGFLYYVSRTGTTGTQATLSQTLRNEIANLRAETELPIAVGFGISTPEQAKEVASFADGVIVGSALVKLLEENDKVAAKNKLIYLAERFAGGLMVDT